MLDQFVDAFGVAAHDGGEDGWVRWNGAVGDGRGWEAWDGMGEDGGKLVGEVGHLCGREEGTNDGVALVFDGAGDGAGGVAAVVVLVAMSEGGWVRNHGEFGGGA